MKKLHVNKGQLLVMLCIGICTYFFSCAKNNEETLAAESQTDTTATTGNSCDTTNMTYAKNIQPILSSNCYKCHGSGSSMDLSNFKTLTAVVKSGALLNSIKHTGSVTPMPLNAAQLSRCDINKIAAWINTRANNN